MLSADGGGQYWREKVSKLISAPGASDSQPVYWQLYAFGPDFIGIFDRRDRIDGLFYPYIEPISKVFLVVLCIF